MREMTTDELRALVEQAREADDFPGYFLYCQVGISGVRSSFEWVDSDGFLRTRDDLADEAELDCMGAAAPRTDPDEFGAGVNAYIARLEARGVLIPLYYGD